MLDGQTAQHRNSVIHSLNYTHKLTLNCTLSHQKTKIKQQAM